MCYIGNIKELFGKWALVRKSEGDTVIAQFDDLGITYENVNIHGEKVPVASGWHEFPKEDFESDDLFTGEI
jgi:hypothetical protein